MFLGLKLVPNGFLSDRDWIPVCFPSGPYWTPKTTITWTMADLRKNRKKMHVRLHTCIPMLGCLARLVGWVTAWQAGWQTDWLAGRCWPAAWPAGCPGDWLTDWPAGWPTLIWFSSFENADQYPWPSCSCAPLSDLPLPCKTIMSCVAKHSDPPPLQDILRQSRKNSLYECRYIYIYIYMYINISSKLVNSWDGCSAQ